jgi:pantoate--beta-alanine ligase
VVSILFNIAGPDRAYFGQKDAQQAIIIKKMVRDLHVPVDITVCPIVREKDGLALSSRNVYLSGEERVQATALYRGLTLAGEYLKSGRPDSADVKTLTDIITGEILKQPLAKIDYVKISDGDSLEDIAAVAPGKTALAAVAVRFGKTRLIDNRLLSSERRRTT